MEFLGLLVPFVAAGGWLWWIHHMDRFEKEPWGLVLKTAGAGAAAGLAGLIALTLLALPLKLGLGLSMFLLAPVHAILMSVVLRLLPYRRPEWNEPFDGLVYGGAAGIGYGLIYTLFSLTDSPLLGFRLAIFSMPIYMLAGLIVGHYLSQMRFGPPEQAGAIRRQGILIASLYLAGIALAEALGGEVMGRANPLASVIVYAANTVGWVLAMHAMDAKHRASQYNPLNYRLHLADTVCPYCQTVLIANAAYCNCCGQPVVPWKEEQA